MSSINILQEYRRQITVPLVLTSAFSNKRAIAFIGADISSQAGLPDWKELLGKLAEHAYGKQLELGMDGGNFDYYKIGTKLKSDMSDIEFYAALRKQIADFRIHEIPVILEYFIRLPFCAYITTNWDKIIRTFIEVFIPSF